MAHRDLFAGLLPPDAIVVGDAAHAVDGCAPECVLFPASIDELSACIAAAYQAGLAVIPLGAGARLGVGRPPERYDVALSTQRLARIVAHEAADMTVTVEAGVTLAALNDTLARAGQCLPLDPPHPERATIGGLIATDASGPLRLSQGKVRDLLIGITVVLADGTIVHGGGRVVKNVAGYDLMKLFTGSHGTLGVIVQVTFKVRPLPERDAAFVLPAPTLDAALTLAMAVLAAPLAPAYVEVVNAAAASCVGLAGDGIAVVVGCAGSADEIAVQAARLRALVGERGLRVGGDTDTARLSAALRDFPAEAPAGGTLSVLPSRLAEVLCGVEDEVARHGGEVAVLAHVGSGVACLRVLAGAVPPFAEALRAAARAAGGWVVFDALPTSLKTAIDPWGAEIPGLALMRGIKQTLDPQRCLSPGRFVGGI